MSKRPKKQEDKLQWIEDEPAQPQSSSPDELPVVGEKSFKKHVLNKLGENLLVPIGLLATTACLTMGLVSMKKGDSRRQQTFMKGRVGFQLFTLVAMTSGMYLTTRNKNGATR